VRAIPFVRGAGPSRRRAGVHPGWRVRRRALAGPRFLCEAFAEQAGRAPTSDEQAALAKRARELGAKQALRALFKLHGDALVVWLLGNGE
jgi:hypothetical protein